MKQPLIGIVPLVDEARESYWMLPGYMQGVEQAGGVPVVLPLTDDAAALRQLADTCDGFLLTGGQDVSPALYGAAPTPQCGQTCPARDAMEARLLDLALAADKPVLGICRGIQLLNVALGGDIYQDIPSQFPQDFPIAHTQPFDYVIPSHKVRVVPGTLLARLTGCETLQVNSMHHQACRKIAPGLTACGHAAGGLTEAIEKPDYPFFLGVQWHPEYLWEQDPAMRQLFEAFVKAAR